MALARSAGTLGGGEGPPARMTTADLIEHLLRSLDEIVMPALAAYTVWLVRSWLEKHK